MPLMLVGSSPAGRGEHMGESGQALAMMLGHRILGLDRIGQCGDDALGALHLGHHEREPAGAAQSSEELRLVERLGQEIVRTGIEPGDDVIDRGAAGQQDHRQRHGPRIGAQPPADLEAVHPGQPDVEQDDVGRELERCRQPRWTVDGGDRAIARPLEQPRQEDAVRRVVLDHEDRGRRGLGAHGHSGGGGHLRGV